MIIKTENFVKYQNLMKIVSNKDSESEQVLYLDFENSKFGVESDIFIAQVNFEHTVDSKKIDNFYVNTREFLILCNRYNEIEVTENKIFKNGEQKFNLLVDKDSDFFDVDIDINDYQKIPLHEEAIEAIVDGSIFCGDNYDMNFEGVRIDKNKIISTNRITLYEAIVSNNLLEDGDVDLSDNFIPILDSISFNTLYLYVNKNKDDIIIKDDKEECFVIGFDLEVLGIPQNLDDENIVSAYNHDKFFTVNKESFIADLEFVGGFVYGIINEKIYIYFEDSNTIIFRTSEDEEASLINYRCPVEFSDESQIGEGFWTLRKSLYNAVKVIQDSEIKIQIDLTIENMRAYNVTGITNTNRHIAIGTVEDN